MMDIYLRRTRWGLDYFVKAIAESVDWVQVNIAHVQ